MRVIFSIIFLVVLCNFTFTQNETDVLRYSTTDIFGSARFEAMAGSFGALGADISAIQINPAGMGRFSSSKATLSFNNSFIENSSLYNNKAGYATHNKFTVSSAGFILTNDLSANNDGRRYGQFTFAYTRLKNFSNNRVYEGQNFNSLLEVFAVDGYGIDPDLIYSYRPFTTGLAYAVSALGYDEGAGEYFPNLTMGDMYHHRVIQTRGGIGEYNIGYSENYGDFLYYGVSLGIRRVKYTENYTHNEKLLDTVNVSLRSFDYIYHLKTKGTGINLKMGVLYLPSESFRLGLSFESPTVIKLNDEWSADMTATHDDVIVSILPEYVPKGRFEYRIKTPMKLRSSFAYIFGMRGAINLDLELSRLQGGKLMPYNTYTHPGNEYEFSVENKEVKQQFRTVLNTRIGIEYMLIDNFYLRGGFALLPQPFKKEIGNINEPNTTFSGGVGWENQTLYIDVAYRLLNISEDYYAFDPSKQQNRAKFNTKIHNFVLTAGLRF